MIALQDFEKKLTKVRGSLERRLSHSYLQQFVASPPIDEDKLVLLYSFLDSLGMEEVRTETYTITAMLLQIALDTHELVRENTPGEGDDDRKVRQLTVLAGVYYSGLYYKLLAETEEIKLIDMLAAGVRTINDKKILVYRQEAKTIEVLMESLKEIEGSLICKVADFCEVSTWKDLVIESLFVKRLLREEKQFIETGASIVFDSLRKLSLLNSDQSLQHVTKEQDKHLFEICERYREFSINKIIETRKKLTGINHVLSQWLETLLGEHQSMVNIFAEEG
ncbi:heptaprenyl diphosphate synthase component 1 [Bacillus massilinigeriensis]|uniref:heptaprenyl diphosphate synthase component 1 n=1 Tax=Bacillus mediterraneensis TaxID=1805474 RepID=UPI0009F6555C|nr:heptaprenyl diphosphate synthase component 1 [Bacillus mediterraneensis]